MKILIKPILCVGLIAIAYYAQAASTPDDQPTTAPIVNRTLTLTEAVTLAEHLSIGLRQSQADVDSANAQVQGARSQTKVSASANIYGAVGNGANVISGAPDAPAQNLFVTPTHAFTDQNVTAMVPISNGGRLADRLRSMRLDADASRDTLGAAKVNLQASATQAYVAVLLAQALEQTSAQKVAAEVEQVQVTKDKVDAGKLARVDLLREQAELASAREADSDALAAITDAQADLATTIGVDVTSQLSLTDTLASLTGQPVGDQSIPTTMAEALDTALANRLEIKAAAITVDADSSTIEGVRSGAQPQLYGFGMADLTEAGSGTDGTYTVGVAASMPITDGGLRAADTADATAKYNRSRADLESARQTVSREVVQAWTALQTANAKVDAANAGLAAASEGYDLANLLYEAGKSTTAERLDSLAALTRARGDQAAAEAAVIVARAELVAAVGG